MQISLIEVWHNMGFAVRCVVLLLSAQAIACVAVVIDRAILLTKSAQQARLVAEAIQGSMRAGAYEAVLSDVSAFASNHLASYLDLGVRTFLERHAAGDEAVRAAEFSRRALERKGDAISRELNRGMNVLASTGSTAPFVGLLGTVLGIINAFKMIAATGSGGIGAIGGAISEALFVTGYGLTVAIPSVLIFNFLSSRIAIYEAGLLNAGSELVDRLETSDDSRRAPLVSDVAPTPTVSPMQVTHAQAPQPSPLPAPGAHAQAPLPRAPLPHAPLPHAQEAQSTHAYASHAQAAPASHVPAPHAPHAQSPQAPRTPGLPPQRLPSPRVRAR